MTFTKQLAVFINKGDTINIVQCERSIDLNTSLNGVIIRSLANEIGENQLVTVLVGLILRTSSFFNITNNLSRDQAIETAYMLIDRFNTETIEDFVLMFKNAKAGKYGKLFNRLDGQIILEWMGLYLEEKAEFRETLHKRIKSNSSNEANDITKLIELKTVDNQKSIIDALKEGVEFDKMKKEESEFLEYKKNYILNKHKTKK